MANESSGEIFSGAPIPAGHDGPTPSDRRAGFVRIEPDGSAHVWRMYPPGSLFDAAKEADDRMREFPTKTKDGKPSCRRWARIIEADPEEEFGRLPAEARAHVGFKLGTFFLEESGDEFSVLAYVLKPSRFFERYEALRRARGGRPSRMRVFKVGKGGVIWDSAEQMESTDFGRVKVASDERVTAGGIILP